MYVVMRIHRYLNVLWVEGFFDVVLLRGKPCFALSLSALGFDNV